MMNVLMMIGMFFSMGFHFLGIGSHKLIGLFTVLLFIVHNVRNKSWYRSLFKGRYGPVRTVSTILNAVMWLAMIGIMVSGVLLSKEMTAGLGGTMTAGRILHNVSSYIGCAGIALHIGLHLKRRTNHDDR